MDLTTTGRLGMGSHILRFLRSEGIKNVVVVFTRDGDSYMGTNRFSEALECVKDDVHI